MLRKILNYMLLIILGSLYCYVVAFAYILLGNLSGEIPQYVGITVFIIFIIIQFVLIIINNKLWLKLLCQFLFFAFTIGLIFII